MKKLVRYSLTSLFLLAAAQAAAVGTRRFVLDEAAEFKGGDLKGVALDSAGHVRAGLSLGAVPATDANSVWSALPMADDSLLLGTGNEGKLLKLQGGAVTLLAETKALAMESSFGGMGVDDEAYARLVKMHSDRRQTREASEGLASFAEKRAANWGVAK